MELRWLDERLVALDIHHHIEFLSDVFVGFPDAVRTTLVVDACHHSPATERFHDIIDALVVRGDHCSIEHTIDLTIDAFDDCAASKKCQWFGREPR